MQDFGKFFWHVSHRVQITFILTDDVRVLYLSYNVKKYRKSNSWWSVAVYSKTIFSQSNLTAQIEQVQDK